MSKSLKKETLPAPQGEVSPHSSPLLLRAPLLGAPAAQTWQGGGKSSDGSGNGHLRAAVNNSPGTTPAPTESLAQDSKPCVLAQLECTRSEGCVIICHPLVMSGPIAWRHHNGPSLPTALTLSVLQPQHMHLRLPQRHYPLYPPMSRLVLGISVSCQSLKSCLCLPRAPSGCSGRGYTSPGTCGKRVHLILTCASLGSCRTKSRRLSTGSPHAPAQLASPLGSPASSHMGLTGSTWLSPGDFIPSFSPSQRAQG